MPRKTRSRKSRTASAKTLTTIRSKSRKSKSNSKDGLANSKMSLVELQFLAKSHGIPFGGLSKSKLIKKINNYA